MAARGEYVEGERQQRVPGEDRRADAEEAPRRRAMPPGQVAVHDVVVQQREVVHQLDRHRGRHRLAGRAADDRRGQQHERRADGLAAVRRHLRAMLVPPAEVVAGDPPHGRR
jgi:hypothetical protein